MTGKHPNERLDHTSGGRQLGGTKFGQVPGEGQPDDPERKSQRILDNDEQSRFDRNPPPLGPGSGKAKKQH